jgi:hypothetical protein
MEPGTVFYEAKAGPYVPLTEPEIASWAPHESDAAATEYLAQLRNLFIS